MDVLFGDFSFIKLVAHLGSVVQHLGLQIVSSEWAEVHGGRVLIEISEKQKSSGLLIVVFIAERR